MRPRLDDEDAAATHVTYSAACMVVTRFVCLACYALLCFCSNYLHSLLPDDSFDSFTNGARTVGCDGRCGTIGGSSRGGAHGFDHMGTCNFPLGGMVMW